MISEPIIIIFDDEEGDADGVHACLAAHWPGATLVTAPIIGADPAVVPAPDAAIIRQRASVEAAVSLCRRVHEASETSSPPTLVLLDREAAPDARAAALAAGADAVLNLPASGDEIVSRVRLLLRLRRAAQALRDSEDRFAAFMRHLPAAAYMKDEEGRLVYANTAFERTLGLDSVGWKDKTDFDLWPPETARRIRDDDVAVLQSDEPRLIEECVTLGGKPCQWLTAKFPFRDASGHRYLAGMSLDITERKRAEAALRESEERFRRTFDLAPIGAAIVALDFHFQRVNEALCRIVGYTEDELKRLTFPDITHPDDLAADIAQARRLAAGEIGQYELDKRYIHKHGHPVWVRLWVRLIRDAEGRPLYYLPMIEDITEQKNAEQALRDSERRFRAIFEHAPTGIALGDPRGRIVQANPALCRFLGYSAREIGGVLVRDITHPDDYDDEVARVADVLAGRAESFRTEKRYVRKDGSIVWGHLTLSAVRSETGAPMMAIGMVEDITQRKRVEDALRRSEESERSFRKRLAALLEVDNELSNEPTFDALCRRAVVLGRSRLRFDRVGIWFLGDTPGEMIGSFGTDEQGHIRDERSMRLRGDASLRELLARRQPTTAIISNDRPLHNANAEIVGHGAYAGAGMWDGQTMIGAVFVDNYLHHKPITAQDAEVLAIFASTLGHLCSRHRAMQALRESESRYRLLFDTMLHAIALHEILCDEQGRPVDTRFVEINAGFERLTGLRRGDVVGRRMLEVFPDLEPEWIRTLGDVALTGRATRFQRYTRATHRAYDVVAYSPQRGHFAVLFDDITQRVRAEDDLRRAQEQILHHQQQETQRVEAELARVREELIRQTRLATLGQVAGSIAHELRNPLGAIRNAAYYLRRELADRTPDCTAHVQLINDVVARADRAISDLLEMSRGKEPRKEQIDLSALIDAAWQRAGVSPGVTRRLDLDPEPFAAFGDAAMLEQVLGNVVTNADQAMRGRGEITITARREAAFDVILVRDTGPGVPPTARARVFEPLFTTKARGTGLGLTICAQIVQRHGGTIELVDDAQPGTAFAIRLPRRG